MTDQDEHAQLAGVDRAALVFAATAGAITVATGSGAWTAFSSFVGLVLLTLVLAFHRPMPRTRSVRSLLMRGAFGATLTLCLYIVLAWFLQGTWADMDQAPAAPMLLLNVAVTVVFAAMERRVSRLLDAEF